MSDRLSANLETMILAMESRLFLSETNELGLAFSQADLKPVINHVREKVHAMTPVARVDLLNKLSETVQPLYKITSVCQFKSVKKLNYSEYANMDSVCDVLMLYTIEMCITADATKACNIVADVISDIDSTKPAYKNSLSYKFLRMFLLLVIVGDYVTASCIATFILTQIGE